MKQTFRQTYRGCHRSQAFIPCFSSAMQTTFANMKPGYEKTQVFTDDRAPIEWIVNDMVVRFALSGQLEGLGQ